MQNNLGDKIKRLRIRAKKTQLDLELELGMSTGSLSRIESGQVNPTKETLLNIIALLDLAPIEAASLFNVDVSSELTRITNFATLLNLEDIDLILEKIVENIKQIFNIDPVALWLWNDKTQTIQLKEMRIRNDVKNFAEKVMGFKATGFILHANDPKYDKNDYLKCLMEEKIIETTDTYYLTYPHVPKKISAVLNKWLGLQMALNFPLIFNDTKLGVLGVMWKDSYISPTEKALLQSYADQIAILIYHAKAFNEMKEKYIELKTKYGE